jgi:Ohr subfamily peroxiredoxin
MGGPGGELSNPEQLFAAGYAACFHSALKIVAKKVGVSTDGSTVSAAVGIGPDGTGSFGLQVTLSVSIPGADAGKAREALHAAHQVCPYSKATRGNIDVTLELA